MISEALDGLNDRDEVTYGFRLLEEELATRVGSGDRFARRVLEGARASERNREFPGSLGGRG